MTLPFHRPPPHQGRRCSSSIPTRRSISEARFDSSLAGAIPLALALRRLRRENNTAREATIRRLCRTSAQLTHAEVKGSGFPRRKLFHLHCRAAMRPIAVFNRIAPHRRLMALTNTARLLTNVDDLDSSGLGIISTASRLARLAA